MISFVRPLPVLEFSKPPEKCVGVGGLEGGNTTRVRQLVELPALGVSGVGEELHPLLLTFLSSDGGS